MPVHEQAVRQSIRLFIAGSAGLLRPVHPVSYQPYPELTRHGTGQNTEPNRAFTDWLQLLAQNACLDQACCHQINQLYRNSGLSMLQLQDVPVTERAVMMQLLKKKGHDWGNGCLPSASEEALWGQLEAEPAGRVMDLMWLRPTSLAVEINGFNGGLLDGVESAYNYYLRAYGTKWPCGYDAEITNSEGCLTIDFDTPWSPPEECLMASLSEGSLTVSHYYSEAGCDFCGYREYEDGELTGLCDDSLEYEYSEEDEDGFSDVIGPDWLIGNVPNYGG